MSLINEALKRAKQETIRREAAQKGVPLPVLDRAPRRSPWTLMVMGVMGAALVASLTALLMLSRNQAPPAARAEPPPVAASQVEPLEETAPTPAPEPSRTEELVATASPPTATRTEPRPVVAAPTTPEPEEMTAMPKAVTAEPLAEDLTRPEAAPETTADQPAGTTYVHRAELADGVTFELGGIAWSEFGPIALLNGRAVGQGERVNGYLVVEIDPQQVEMRGTVGSIFIRLK